ncbi:hypothetical protein Taro_047838 [Colocasia esculenta]|uniref:aldehyde oxygenase (deformylating) n=1 Tax=Colocasia esculenta TaxID=4460 RepID=A0A843X7H6_COLES|nr:hypothetical protein [Colocasia esculenta]
MRDAQRSTWTVCQHSPSATPPPPLPPHRGTYCALSSPGAFLAYSRFRLSLVSSGSCFALPRSRAGAGLPTDPVAICPLNPRPIHMANALESGWQYLITHFTEFQLASVGTFLLHEGVFFLSGLPFIFFERAGFLNKYKIQGKNNTVEAQEKCVLRLLLYHFCVNLPVMLVSYPVFRYMGLRTTLPLPPWSVVLSQIIFYFIIEDFVFYWGHRVLHTKWLYKHVHSVHHEYATPFGLTSEYAHPAEILFLGFATVLGPALTGPHLFTLWLWMVLRVLETVEAHCGYHFPWSLSNFIPLYGGADFHDYHHRVLYTKSGNYSSTFTYMDQ